MNRYILLTSVKVIICFKMIFVNTNTNNQPCVSLLTLTSMLEVVNIHYKTIVIIVMSHFDFCTTILAANNSLCCATFENPYELNSKQRKMHVTFDFFLKKWLVKKLLRYLIECSILHGKKFGLSVKNI